MRLGQNNLSEVPAGVGRPSYDRSALKAGIVHLGIGAFHRGHQACYTDRALAQGEGEWGITGVSLRSAGVARQLNPQDGLYTVTERSREGQVIRVVGSVREVLVASEAPEAVIAAIAAPGTFIVTLTVTEKGYCRKADGGLDMQMADEGSIFAFLEKGLRRRREEGRAGLTLLSCDNLAENGKQLERLMRAYLALKDPELGAWVEKACTFPCSMVDRIVPATTEADRARVAEVLGMGDEGAIVTEPFSQWVIEDRFAGPRPAWEAHGAQLVEDVVPYETAKLRLLNGAHSALAYLGLEKGHGFVHEAVADPAVRPVVERLMREEAKPSITPAPGQDLDAYIDALLERFANPALEHRLIQIAMDGSQKIAPRWLEVLAIADREGRACPAILAALGAWLRHVRGDNAAKWGALDDPLADRLASLIDLVGAEGLPEVLFGADGLFASSWTAGPEALERLRAAL